MANFTCGRCGESVDVRSGLSAEAIAQALIDHRGACRAPAKELRADSHETARRALYANLEDTRRRR